MARFWDFLHRRARPTAQPTPNPPRQEPTLPPFTRYAHSAPFPGALPGMGAEGPGAARLRPYRPPSGVVGQGYGLGTASTAQGGASMAQDGALPVGSLAQAWMGAGTGPHAAWLADGLGFMGYPYLAEMAQRAEFRKPCEVIARECVREWIEIKATTPHPSTPPQTGTNPKGSGGPAGAVGIGGVEKARGAEDAEAPGGAEESAADLASRNVRELENTLQSFGVRDIIHRATLDALLYGLSHIWVDVRGVGLGPLDQDIPLLLTKEAGLQGRLKGFKRLEPIWTTPNAYNAESPLLPDYYQPQNWWVQGSLIHHTRLLTMVPYPVSELLRPAFNFGGLSLTQQLRPYVHNYLRTRNAVANITANFSNLVLKTDMAAQMQQTMGAGQGGGLDSLLGRVNVMRRLSEGQNTIVADKEAEDVSVVSAPLGGLDRLQAQAQEAMAAIPGIPLVKLFGITPTGLNASDEGSIRVFYDEIAAFQQSHLRPILERMVQMVQLHLWGEVKPGLDFTFRPLWQMDSRTRAEVEKMKADTDTANIKAGIITPQEARQRQNADVDSPYSALALPNDLPQPPPGPGAPPALPPHGHAGTGEKPGPEDAGPKGPDKPGDGGPKGLESESAGPEGPEDTDASKHPGGGKLDRTTLPSGLNPSSPLARMAADERSRWLTAGPRPSNIHGGSQGLGTDHNPYHDQKGRFTHKEGGSESGPSLEGQHKAGGAEKHSATHGGTGHHSGTARSGLIKTGSHAHASIRFASTGGGEESAHHAEATPEETAAKEAVKRAKWAEDFGAKDYKPGQSMPQANGEWTFGTGRAKDGWVPDYDYALEKGNQRRFPNKPRNFQSNLRFNYGKHYNRDLERLKLGHEPTTGLHKLTGSIKQQNEDAAKPIRDLKRTKSRNIVYLLKDGSTGRYDTIYGVWSPKKGAPGAAFGQNGEFKFYLDTLDNLGFQRPKDHVAQEHKKKTSGKKSRKNALVKKNGNAPLKENPPQQVESKPASPEHTQADKPQLKPTPSEAPEAKSPAPHNTVSKPAKKLAQSSKTPSLKQLKILGRSLRLLKPAIRIGSKLYPPAQKIEDVASILWDLYNDWKAWKGDK
ncbi:DUF1073 domain-containing protein [Formicincola oecophyllae]|uniref:DUF1073 domain-containing protein n=1 Tax=Formicincola oecophyllae TaxID=2558361 RepID=A0A4Y6UCC8_9PROT|nr:DUF1073 domain-containing protein [Formicincola oecophyllae]QDH14097.1 DUF1073 domain-containing protein [Formicincola oecophyllae]